MQVNYINAIAANTYPNNKYNSRNEISYNIPSFRVGICSDTFVKQPSFTSGEKPFTIDWYNQLTPQQKAINNERVNNHIYHNKEYLFHDRAFNHDLKYHNIVATGIKDTLDNQFGKGNYIVVTLGRSLSSIGKCLSYKIGEDNVKQIPMSAAGRFLDLEKCNEDFSLFNEYLKSVGLSKDSVKKSDKQYIFIDYCNSGRSLKGAKNLFESDKIWGHLDNVQFVDVFNLLTDIKPGQEIDGITTDTFLNNLRKDLAHSRYKQYSMVKDCPRFHYLKDSVPEPKSYTFDQQAFYWKLLDYEISKNSL